jgi:hypothetical protein
MFLLSPEADILPGDLHTQLSGGNRVLLAGREARQVPANLEVFRTATPAHCRHTVGTTVFKEPEGS